MFRVCRSGSIAPLKEIEYGVYGDLIIVYKAIFYLLKGDYRVQVQGHLLAGRMLG